MLNRSSPKCPQPAAPNNSSIYQSHIDFPDVGESETECLNLFIVRPSPVALSEAGYDPTQTKLPVYFYIHGGGFGFGAGTDPIWGMYLSRPSVHLPARTEVVVVADPTRLVQCALALYKPFIAVVINYRLNLFGFAASSSIVAAQEGPRLKGCNFGINDQKIALKWVSSNISSFGGDPRNITLGGQSAGGCSVHTHVLEARSRREPPLFERAIIQSGAFTSVGIGPVPLEECDKRWHTLCEYFGLTDQPEHQRMAVLQKLPAADLIKAGGDLGWMVFFLTNDNLTITPSSDDEWTIDFDQIGTRDASQTYTPTRPIKVLMGNTEAEVRLGSFGSQMILLADTAPGKPLHI
jgi:carboxylesterase type B